MPPSTTTLPLTSSNPPPTPTPTSPPPLLLALSGPTSSGKTTLATALRAIFPPPHPLLLHADDFYKPDSQIPLTGSGIQDWDCAGSLDLDRLETVLRAIKEGGGEALPVGLARQGNFEGDGDGDGVHGAVRGIAADVIDRVAGEVRGWMGMGRQLVIVEGFLLFGRSVPGSLRELFDVKILLAASYGDAKRRRERRNGYVTLEGFWEDPEGYFDEVVWPNYVGEHGGLVGLGEEGGDGGWKEGVRVSGEGWGLEECLGWVVGVVRGEVERGEGGG